jgi:hypothetical protein
VNREISEVNGFGQPLRRDLATPADQQLAKTPAPKAAAGVEEGEPVFGRQRQDLFQKAWSFGAGSGKERVDGSKDGREGLVPVQIQKPASDFPATGANGEQMKELLVLLHGSIHGKPALQGAGIEVFVLHGNLLSIFCAGA